jgi:hypothetical protein
MDTKQVSPETPPEPRADVARAGGPAWPPWPTWKALHGLSNVHFLRVSYIALIGVPLLAVIQERAAPEWFTGVPWSLRLGYLSSILLSVAHMVYQAFCPQLMRRFDSPNDLYRDMLAIKALQQQYLPLDTAFTFDIAHCREGFDRANGAKPFARLFCGACYVAGLALFGWLVLERSLLVFGVRL